MGAKNSGGRDTLNDTNIETLVETKQKTKEISDYSNYSPLYVNFSVFAKKKKKLNE